jgi:diadenosine tetraphosphatase ApaH/serine/threonine PP2A family protein phosphatase
MSRFDNFCFQGHTHIPGVFKPSGVFITPEEREHHFQLGDEKCMVNVGSVGQPRDGNPRPCFVVLDDEELTLDYYRVEYEVQKTRDKIYAILDLENMLGDRLLTGR